jgi:hypothetical protein
MLCFVRDQISELEKQFFLENTSRSEDEDPSRVEGEIS